MKSATLSFFVIVLFVNMSFAYEKKDTEEVDRGMSVLFDVAHSFPPHLENREQLEEARKLWNRISQKLEGMFNEDTTNYGLEWYLAECFRLGYNLDMNTRDKIELHYKKVIQNMPEYDLAYIGLGLFYVQTGLTGDIANAESLFRKGLTLSKNPMPLSEAHRGLALAVYLQGNFKEAIHEAELATNIDPTNGYAVQILKALQAVEKRLATGEPTPLPQNNTYNEMKNLFPDKKGELFRYEPSERKDMMPNRPMEQ